MPTTTTMPGRHRSGGAGDRDRGSVSLFFVVAAAGLLVAVGLVVDGGGKIRASQRADAVAAEAARAGGQAADAGPAIRGQGLRLPAAAARAAARDYLAGARVEGTVTITGGTRLQVDTVTTYTPVFLTMIGVGPMTTTGHAEARIVRALNGEQ